jgi:hypothetical protein
VAGLVAVAGTTVGCAVSVAGMAVFAGVTVVTGAQAAAVASNTIRMLFQP